MDDATRTELRRRRRVIDGLDRRILALLVRRTREGRAVGRLKAAAGLPSRDADRETAVIDSLMRHRRGLPAAVVLALWEELFLAARGLRSGRRRRTGSSCCPGREGRPSPTAPRRPDRR